MKILIAGLPKTGTSGLFYLVSNSIPEKKKLFFEPKECPFDIAGTLGNVVAKILIGPNLKSENFFGFEKKITILRDPRDRIVSSLLYSQFHASYLDDSNGVARVMNLLEEKEKRPKEISLKEIIKTIGEVEGKPNFIENHKQVVERSLSWFDHYVEKNPDALLYNYEKFVVGDYCQIEKFLGLPMTGAPDVPGGLERVERTKSYDNWRDWFTDEDVATYRPLLTHWLEKYDYDSDDWQLNITPTIKPEHSSKYFARLVNEYHKGHSRSASMSQSDLQQTSAGSEQRLAGRVLRVEPKLVAGWAIGNNPLVPVQLAVFINGEEVARVVADKPRPNLKERGIHPTGDCGFVFRFEGDRALFQGDEVKIMPLEKSFELENWSSKVP